MVPIVRYDQFLPALTVNIMAGASTRLANLKPCSAKESVELLETNRLRVT